MEFCIRTCSYHRKKWKSLCRREWSAKEGLIVIDESDVQAYVRMPDCLIKGCSDDMLSSLRTAETILPITEYTKGCFYSLV